MLKKTACKKVAAIETSNLMDKDLLCQIVTRWILEKNLPRLEAYAHLRSKFVRQNPAISRSE